MPCPLAFRPATPTPRRPGWARHAVPLPPSTSAAHPALSGDIGPGLGRVQATAVDRVEEDLVSAARLRPELRAEADQDHAAVAERQLEESGLAGEVLRAEDPAAEVGVAQRVARDDRAVAGRQVEGRAVDEERRLLAA